MRAVPAVLLLVVMGTSARAAQPFTLSSPDLPPGKPIPVRFSANAFGCTNPGDPPHHYTFTVYALSVDHLNVPATSTPANIDYEIFTKTLAKATMVRLFSRPKKGT